MTSAMMIQPTHCARCLGISTYYLWSGVRYLCERCAAVSDR